MTVPPTTIETTTTTEYQPATRGSQFTPPCDPPCIVDDPCLDGLTQWHFLPCETTTTAVASQHQLPATGGGTVLPATGLLLLGLLVCTVARRRTRAV